ncbi:MAG: hypothetical protein HYY90_01805 [Candidatus Omnitrophica bacterium]|nr:hypothetical protein [Candidatus Omnitrophota bacterium]
MRLRPLCSGFGVLVTAMAGWFSIAPASAQQEQELRGEILDPATYLKDGRHGPDLINQTYESLDGGQTLALLDERSGELYLLLAEEPGEDPNELVYDYVNQRLNVTGLVYERGGMRGIVVTSATPVEGAGAQAATTPTAATDD